MPHRRAAAARLALRRPVLLAVLLAAGSLAACAGREAAGKFTVTPKVQVKEATPSTLPGAPRGYQEPPSDEPDPATPPAPAK